MCGTKEAIAISNSTGDGRRRCTLKLRSKMRLWLGYDVDVLTTFTPGEGLKLRSTGDDDEEEDIRGSWRGGSVCERGYLNEAGWFLHSCRVSGFRGT